MALQEEHLAQLGYDTGCCACRGHGFKDLSSFAEVGRSDSYATEFDLEADECLTPWKATLLGVGHEMESTYLRNSIKILQDPRGGPQDCWCFPCGLANCLQRLLLELEVA